MTSPYAAARQRVANVDRRWRDLPLRTRLTTAAALSATLAIVAVIAVAYLAVRHELRAQIDDQLHRQAGEAQVLHEVGPIGPHTEIQSQVGDIGGFLQLINSHGQVQRANNATVTLPVTSKDRRIAARGDGRALQDARVGGMHVRVLTQPLGTGYPGV